MSSSLVWVRVVLVSVSLVPYIYYHSCCLLRWLAWLSYCIFSSPWNSVSPRLDGVVPQGHCRNCVEVFSLRTFIHNWIKPLSVFRERGDLGFVLILSVLERKQSFQNSQTGCSFLELMLSMWNFRAHVNQGISLAHTDHRTQSSSGSRVL